MRVFLVLLFERLVCEYIVNFAILVHMFCSFSALNFCHRRRCLDTLRALILYLAQISEILYHDALDEQRWSHFFCNI